MAALNILDPVVQVHPGTSLSSYTHFHPICAQIRTRKARSLTLTLVRSSAPPKPRRKAPLRTPPARPTPQKQDRSPDRSTDPPKSLRYARFADRSRLPATLDGRAVEPALLSAEAGGGNTPRFAFPAPLLCSGHSTRRNAGSEVRCRQEGSA